MLEINADKNKDYLRIKVEGCNGDLLDEIATATSVLIAKLSEGKRSTYRKCVKDITDGLFEKMDASFSSVEDPDNIDLSSCDNKDSEKIIKDLKELLKTIKDFDKKEDDDSEKN